VVNWFNRRGGQPTVTHTPNSGVYNVTFPGSAFNIDTNVVPVATLVSTAGEIGVDTFGGAVAVDTFNSVGVATDLDLALVVFDSSTTG
jgi:hypothetical protein